jgi:transcriptional regulator GlxA family with amidase domain
MDKRITRRSMLAGGAAVGAAAVASQLPASKSEQTGARALQPGSDQIPVAFVMDDGATMIDFSGPWEVFQDAGVANVPGFTLFTVAPTRDLLQTTGNMKMVNGQHHMTGLKFTADYTFQDAPQPRVILMGAQKGGVAGPDPAKLDWIRKAAERADVVMSVCTGAFILASTGLLDGLSATTHHWFFDQFAQKFPRVNLVRGRRFVDNGKLITAGGLTSGVDAALHVVQRFYGAAAAQQVADYMEYQSAGWKA